MAHKYSTNLEELVYSKDFESVCNIADSTWYGATKIGNFLDKAVDLLPYVWCYVHGQSTAILFQCSEAEAIARARAAEDRDVDTL